MVFQALTGIENNILAHSRAFEEIVADSQNFNVDGYKSTRSVFSQLFAQEVGTIPRSSHNGGAVYQNKATLSGSTTLVPLGINFEQGTIRDEGTSKPLSAAITGVSFFMVREGGRTLLTRAANWSFNSEGQLVDIQGRQVMGFKFENGQIDRSTLVPIQVDVNDVSQLDSGFETDGVLTSNFQQRNAGLNLPATPLFELGLALVPNPAGLKIEPGTAYSLTRQSGEVLKTGVSGEDGFGAVTGSASEQSTVDPAELSVRGVQLQRSFNALQNSLTLVSKFLDTMITTTGKAIG